MLELNNVNQRYFYGRKAVDNMSFCLQDGESLALFAKEGGGKTSLLKAIAGLYPIEEGSVIVNGSDITRLKPKQRGVRLVYSGKEGLFGFRSVEYNLSYPLKLRKYPKCDISDIVNDVANRFGLSPFMKEPVYRVSDAETIRLALARAALRRADVTLIDNIFACLTGYARVSLFEELLPEMSKIEGNVIFVTDDCFEALKFGDKLGVVNEGKLIDFGTHDAVINNPDGYFTDVAFGTDRTHGIACVNNGSVMLDGKTYKLSEYFKDEVLFSYILIEQSDGREFIPVRYDYSSRGGMIATSENGERLLVSARKDSFNVAIDTKSIRMFDIAYEKSLTIE